MAIALCPSNNHPSHSSCDSIDRVLRVASLLEPLLLCRERSLLSQTALCNRAFFFVMYCHPHLSTNVGEGVGVEIELDVTVSPDDARFFPVHQNGFPVESLRNAGETELRRTKHDGGT